MRVVLAEDLALLRDGLIRLLEAHDFEVVEAVDNGPSLLARCTTHRPDVAVVDVRLPPTFTDEGLRAAIEARAAPCRGCRCSCCRSTSSSSTPASCWPSGAGAVGYLLKDRVADVAAFVDAVRQVAAGGTSMDPEVVATLLTRRGRDAPLERLTPREREVLGLMAEGRSNAAIAARCSSPRRRSASTPTASSPSSTCRVRGRQPAGARRARLPRQLARAHQRHSQTGSISCSSSGRPWDSRSVTRCPSLLGDRMVYAVSSTSPRS